MTTKLGSWEPFFQPNLSSRRGKSHVYRRYPGKPVFYGVEAKWSAPNVLVAIRGFVNLNGKRIWTGPEKLYFTDAKNDALAWARNWKEN